MWGPVLVLLDIGREAPKQKRKGRRQIINDALLLLKARLNAPSLDDELVYTDFGLGEGLSEFAGTKHDPIVQSCS